MSSSSQPIGSTVAPRPIEPSEIERIRSLLPETTERVYLNAGFLGPLPAASVDAMTAVLEREAHDRVPRDWPERLTALQERVRTLVARLGDALPDQVALTHATHDAVSLALWGLDLEPGAVIVTTDEEHPGILAPLRVLRDRLGVDIRRVTVAGGEGIVERIQEAARGAAAVALSHVCWVSGTVLPIAEIATALDELRPPQNGGSRSFPGRVPLLVDGAQGAGALPVSLRGFGCDAYTVSAHKWTLGPNGCGALVLANPERWRPTFGGFFGVEDVFDPLGSPYRVTGQRLEFAQEAMLPLAGWSASLTVLLDGIGIHHAAAHSAWLNAQLREQLASLGGFSNLRGSAHLLCFDGPGGQAARIVDRLDAEGIAIRDLGPTMLRASLGCWNTIEDIERLSSALAAILD